MAITLRDNTSTNTGKGTELTYLEMDTNMESFYYSSSIDGTDLHLFTTGSIVHTVPLGGAISAGAQGVQGIQGIQGTQGTQGITGAGSQGTQGITGTGIQGTQGITGTGAQGTQGITGTGTQGVQGTQGIQGTTPSTRVYRILTGAGLTTTINNTSTPSISDVNGATIQWTPGTSTSKLKFGLGTLTSDFNCTILNENNGTAPGSHAGTGTLEVVTPGAKNGWYIDSFGYVTSLNERWHEQTGISVNGNTGVIPGRYVDWASMTRISMDYSLSNITIYSTNWEDDI